MKRSITLILLLALFAGLLTGCDSWDAKYQPSENEYKWICEELDMWFLCVDEPIDSSYYNSYFIGKLTLDGETKVIQAQFCRDDSVFVSEVFSYDRLTDYSSRTLFKGKGNFHEGWFTVNVNEENIDYVGFEKLTFQRVEIDEDGLAWRETVEAKITSGETENGT